MSLGRGQPETASARGFEGLVDAGFAVGAVEAPCHPGAGREHNVADAAAQGPPGLAVGFADVDGGGKARQNDELRG